MKLAIIGLPQSGKSTVYNALTGSQSALTISSGRVEVNTAMLAVPDENLPKLKPIFGAKKMGPAQIAFADVTGFAGGASGEALSGQLLNALSGMDGLILVIRCFEDEAVPHPKGSVDPQRDLIALLEDLMLNDLIAVERKLERLAEERQKGGREITQIEREQALFQRLLEDLNAGIPLREQTLSEEERGLLAGLGLLTDKAVMVLLNLGEGQAQPQIAAEGLPLLGLQGKLEMELAQLSPADTAEFLAEYGLSESGGQRIIRAAYDMLEVQSFYTGAEKEVRAWTLKRGATAVQAADTIHSDMARGFIRAEVIQAAELIELGSLAKAREEGKLRLEGKDYLVQNEDVITVRFNV